jgi:hypothetical protein
LTIRKKPNYDLDGYIIVNIYWEHFLNRVAKSLLQAMYAAHIRASVTVRHLTHTLCNSEPIKSCIIIYHTVIILKCLKTPSPQPPYHN